MSGRVMVAGVQNDGGNAFLVLWLGFQRARKYQLHGSEGLTWKVDERKLQSRVEGGTQQRGEAPWMWLYYGGTDHDVPLGR